MKKISILAFFSALLLLTGCEEVETPDLGVDEQWVQFRNSSYSVQENAEEPVAVVVSYAAAENPNGVTVEYTVETDHPDAFVITPSGMSGTVEIPAGEFEAYIYIDPIDNDQTDEPRSITLTITSDDLPVGVMGEGNIGTTATVNIIDDECVFDPANFEGTFSANEEGYCDGCYEVTVTYNEANNVLMLENLYNTGGTTFIALDNTDPNNPSVDFVSQDLGGVLYVHDTYGDVFAVNPSSVSGDPADDISSFDTCGNYLDLYFKMCVDAGCFTGDPVHIQLTKI